MDNYEFLKFCEKFKDDFDFAKNNIQNFINEIKIQAWISNVLKNNILAEDLVAKLLAKSFKNKGYVKIENKIQKI